MGSGVHEPWQENRPLESFVGIGDQHRGLVVFAKGIHEGGVRDDAARTVFLTLLRWESDRETQREVQNPT